jgi:glyoxylase I family protein
MVPLHGLHHASLTVSDLAKSTAWYCDVLGLEIVFTEDSDDRRAAVLRFAAGGFAIGLTEHGGEDRHFDPRRIGLDHLAFSVSSRPGLERWAERLRDLGVETSGVIEIPPGAILNFKDPDGIALALFWDRPTDAASAPTDV